MPTELKPLTGLVSIHDVMPATLARCQSLVETLQGLGASPITLLVVPGLQWSEAQLHTLRSLQEAGLILAGHGWYHRAQTISGIYHRIHSLVLSRDAAEHLSLSSDQTIGLIRDCHRWFVDNGLNQPTLYVPPAWALGRVASNRLAELPFKLYEVLSGVMNSNGRLRRLPLTGYEADNRLRARSLRPWNNWNEKRARKTGRPLRLGIHPFDEDYLLSGQMRAQLGRCDTFTDYDAAMSTANSFRPN